MNRVSASEILLQIEKFALEGMKMKRVMVKKKCKNCAFLLLNIVLLYKYEPHVS